MTHQASAFWRIGADCCLPLDRPHLLGILNVTPDSFSDGGEYKSAADAVQAAVRMVGEGASIIDIGGESTRPGAAPVASDEQLRRILPVVRAIRDTFSSSHILISIDTTRSEVAKQALDAGANIINDVSAGTDDPHMFKLAAANGCGLILMHRLPHDPGCYIVGDVVQTVRDYLRDRCEAAEDAGVRPECIVIDPGLGFGKSFEQNIELMSRMHEVALGVRHAASSTQQPALTARHTVPGSRALADSRPSPTTPLIYPILSAASRKSFIGKLSGVEMPSHRVAGSVAVTLMHYLAGVRLFRVHDVQAHKQALDVAQALQLERV